MWARTLSRPLSPDTGPHTAKQWWNCWGLNDRGKIASSLSTAYQNPAGRKVYGWAVPGFFLFPSAVGPSKVGAGASPQNAFGCQRQAKRSACPTRGWVKPRSPAVQVLAAQALSALRGDVVWFFPHFFRPSISPSSAGQIAPGLWHKPVADGNQGNGPAPGTRPPHAPVPLRRGYGCHPVSREAHRSAQGEVGDASVFPIAEEQSRFLCIAYQNLTGQGVSGKRFRLQNLPQIFVCSPGKIPLEFLKLPV